MAKDLVCGMEVDEKESVKAEYKGKVFHFCSPVCQRTFEKNPDQFVK